MQQLQSDLQSQVKNVQEKIANLNVNVKGDQTAIFELLLFGRNHYDYPIYIQVLTRTQPTLVNR